MNNAFFLTKWFYLAMRWIYETLLSLTGWQASFVIVLTIAVFTLLIRLLTVFSDISSRKSTAKMTAIQPDLQRLQKKYGNDPQKLNLEQQKLMKEKGVSAFGGCLPLLITMPLFFIFISAFRAWSNEQMLNLLLTMSEDQQAGIDLFNSYKFGWILNIWRPDNLSSSAVLTGEQFWTTFAQTKGTYVTDFVFYTENQAAFDALLLDMGFFVQDATGALSIAEDSTAFLAAYESIMGPCIDQYVGYVNGIGVLPILAGITSFLSSWLMMRNQQPQNQGDESNPTANTGKSMMYIMPIMSVFFCWQYDATFGLYWVFSNIFATASSMIITKNMPVILAKSEEKQAKKLARMKEQNK